MDSVSGHIYFSVTFAPAASGSGGACTGHGGLECPGEDASMRLTDSAVIESLGPQDLLSNGHMGGYKKSVFPLRAAGNNNNPAINNGVGTGCSADGVVVNGDLMPEDVAANSGEGTDAAGRESDYSPIWKYSCKVPNVTTKPDASEPSGEEAIYETVYPAEDYQSQESDAAGLSAGVSCDSSQPVSDDDSPPPLPPRTKSLLKSLADSGHRPLERSIALYPTVVKKRPMPLPTGTAGEPAKAQTISCTPGKVHNGVNEPSVRPKVGHLSASSQSSCDSESSGASFGEVRRLQ